MIALESPRGGAVAEAEPPSYPRPLFDRQAFDGDVFPIETPLTTFGREAAVPPIQLEKRGVTRQRQFLFVRELQRDEICRKLDSIGRSDLIGKMGGCHTEEVYKRCLGCKRASMFFNHCDTKWCPLCAPRLARKRRLEVEWWSSQIRDPKHVIVTVRNVDLLTKEYVLWFKACWTKLRRSRFAHNWRGGFYRLEVTNEGKGFHLHLHALVNSPWIDAGQLAITWAKIVGQDFAIVKVKGCREQSYLAEVTKYVATGEQLAEWLPEHLAAVMDSFDRVRTFDAFGSLYQLRPLWREAQDAIAEQVDACECGCTNWKYLTADELSAAEIAEELYQASRPPPACEVTPVPQNTQLELGTTADI